jgi:hypothetical protein
MIGSARIWRSVQLAGALYLESIRRVVFIMYIDAHTLLHPRFLLCLGILYLYILGIDSWIVDPVSSSYISSMIVPWCVTSKARRASRMLSVGVL